MDLSKKRCIACEGWMKPMPNFLIKKYLKKVKRWKIKKGKLYKEFRFKNFKEALKFVNKAGKIAEKEGFGKVAGIILDLGVSSYQIDTGERGFSYQRQGPLDMRMDPKSKIKASDLINLLERRKLYEIFKNLGEERFASAISSGIVQSRRITAIMTTEDLVKVIAKALKINERNLTPMKRTEIAKRVFQALRMTVNDEISSLKEVLASCPSLLQSSGRLAVISFHSVEDRIAKDSFIDFERRGLGTILTPKPALPSVEETLANRRSKGAKLRIFESNEE